MRLTIDIEKQIVKINEIFCSIQGEGWFTGTASVFVRTSGCNLECSFCDTDHQQGKEMSVADIVATAARYPARHAVITGGEPALQADLGELVEKLHEEGFFVQIETNGTRSLPDDIDWVTCSPKVLEKTVVLQPHEVKVVFQGQDMTPYETLFSPQAWSLQPCDLGHPERNRQIVAAAIAYVLKHPQWRLSLQTHKLIGIK